MSETLTHQRKRALRKEMRHTLKMLQPESKLQSSRVICQAIASLLGDSPLTVASFIALPSEPDLSVLHNDMPQLRIVYPRSLPDGIMHFHHVTDLDQLELGPYDIAQPPDDPNSFVAPAEIDVFLCPGLAYSAAGHRLGKGGGYYDRLLSQRSASSQLIGVCFTGQLTNAVPTEDHDIQVDRVIHG